MSKQYYRTDYGNLAKEFGCMFRVGKRGFNSPLQLIKYYLMRLRGRYDYPRPSLIIPLDGWITDKKEVERVMRERGLEL